MKKWLGFFLILFSFWTSQAQIRRSTPQFTYDLGASTGTYSDLSYTEFQLGLNWYLRDYLAWRNSIFTRFGSEIDSAAGLDSSARFVYRSPLNEQGMGVNVFGGPGVRLSNQENTGIFGEAGVTVHSGGFSIGGGLKSISYFSPGKDKNGNELAKNDTVLFLILAGGGAF